MHKKTIQRLALGGFGISLLVLGLTLVLVIPQEQIVQTELRVYFDPGIGIDTTVLSSVFARFSSLNPHIDITLATSPQEKTMDISLVGTYPSPEPNTMVIPWAIDQWYLLVNKSSFETLKSAKPDLAKDFLEGTLEPSLIDDLLSTIKNQGIIPMALGNSHGWPWMVWVQHLSLALSQGRIDTQLRSTAIPASSQELFLQGDKLLKEWLNKGYFDQGLLSSGWSAGLYSVPKGGAFMSLGSRSQIEELRSMYPNSTLTLPFPRGKLSGTWTVASGIHLVYSKDNPNIKALNLLSNYLTSPGIAQELSQKTGRTFNSWDATTKKLPLVIPSWDQATQSPGYLKLMELLKL